MFNIQVFDIHSRGGPARLHEVPTPQVPDRDPAQRQGKAFLAPAQRRISHICIRLYNSRIHKRKEWSLTI